MTMTTHAEYDGHTEAVTVAAAFPSAIKDRTIVITGANKLGIGFTTAQALASQAPRRLILAGRSTAKVQECIDALRSEYPDVDYRPLQVDLSSQESVRKAASTVMAWEDVPDIDLLINNAGVMNLPERTLSPEGIEMHLATNHVGHFLFTNQILPKLIAAAKDSPRGFVRVINISSVGTVSILLPKRLPIQARAHGWFPSTPVPIPNKSAADGLTSSCQRRQLYQGNQGATRK